MANLKGFELSLFLRFLMFVAFTSIKRNDQFFTFFWAFFLVSGRNKNLYLIQDFFFFLIFNFVCLTKEFQDSILDKIPSYLNHFIQLNF